MRRISEEIQQDMQVIPRWWLGLFLRTDETLLVVNETTLMLFRKKVRKLYLIEFYIGKDVNSGATNVK